MGERSMFDLPWFRFGCILSPRHLGHALSRGISDVSP